jgi:putative membrane protein
MKRIAILAFLIGTLIIVGAVWAADPRAVAAAVLQAGSATFLVIAVRTISVSFAGLAWWLLIPRGSAPQPWVCTLLRIVREGGNSLLPFTQVGGDVISVRLLRFWGIPGALCAASVIVDVLLQAATQFLLALTALALLARAGHSASLVRDIGFALVIAVPALACFYIVQRRWGEALVTSLLRRLARGREWAVHGTVETLFQYLHAIYERRTAIVAATAVHLAVWFFGALEVWIALSGMDYEIDFSSAVIIEGLAQAARGAAFMVPGAVGVQEGGLILLCGLFGIPAQSALALSLIKRAADLAVGVPGLLSWQVLETSRLRKRAAAAR